MLRHGFITHQRISVIMIAETFVNFWLPSMNQCHFSQYNSLTTHFVAQISDALFLVQIYLVSNKILRYKKEC